MSQCGRSQSFLLLYTRPMYAHKQHYSPPHWRIRPLLGQKKSGGRNHSLHKHSRSHLQYTTVCPTPRPGAQGRRMLTFAEVVILLSQRGILTDKDKTLTSNLPKKVWHSWGDPKLFNSNIPVVSFYVFFSRVGRSTADHVEGETAAEAVNVSQRRVPGWVHYFLPFTVTTVQSISISCSQGIATAQQKQNMENQGPCRPLCLPQLQNHGNESWNWPTNNLICCSTLNIMDLAVISLKFSLQEEGWNAHQYIGPTKQLRLKDVKAAAKSRKKAKWVGGETSVGDPFGRGVKDF